MAETLLPATTRLKISQEIHLLSILLLRDCLVFLRTSKWKLKKKEEELAYNNNNNAPLMSETIQPNDSTTGCWIFSIYHPHQLTCIAKVVIKMLSDCLVYYTTVRSLSSGKIQAAPSLRRRPLFLLLLLLLLWLFLLSIYSTLEFGRHPSGPSNSEMRNLFNCLFSSFPRICKLRGEYSWTNNLSGNCCRADLRWTHYREWVGRSSGQKLWQSGWDRQWRNPRWKCRIFGWPKQNGLTLITWIEMNHPVMITYV